MLRESIRSIILQEFEGGGGGDYAGLGLGGAGMPYGMHFASGNQMYNAFIKPFTDVLGVAAGKTKELATKAVSAVKVAYEAIVTTFLPFMSDDYEKIFTAEKASIDKIRSEYSDVYSSTWTAFENNDILVPAFLYSPVAFLTMQFVKKAPQASMHLVSAIGGGMFDNAMMRFITGQSYGHSGGHHRNSTHDMRGDVMGTGMGGYGGGYGTGLGSSVGESVERLFEDDDKNDKKKKSKKDDKKQKMLGRLLKFISSDKVQNKLESSPKVKEMESKGKELVHSTVKKVLEQASAYINANSFEDIKKITGKLPKEAAELTKLPSGEREKAEKLVLATLKKSAKEFYVKQLEAYVKSAASAGVPSDHPFIELYTKVIAKIKAM